MAEQLFPKLFEAAHLGKLRLKNRLVMLPMGTSYATPLGEATRRTIDHYVERAKGGVGLITVGNISPHLPNALNQLTLDSDWVLMGHYELVEKVHAQGTRITAQLNHPGRQKYADSLQPGEELISSSAVPMTLMGQTYPTPKALSKGEIYQVVERFVKAAERAKRVGYDMVELHGAHGYLIHQFVSRFVNKRTDEFGGSPENRMRFPLELIKAIRRAVGPDFPIGIRISAEEFLPGGITLKESVPIAQMLEAAGVAYISVSGALFETMHKFIDVMRDPEGWKEYLWEGIKKAVKVPVIAGGGLRHPEFCERLLKQGKADFIGLARPLLADPEWPLKAREGRPEDIRMCIFCNECLFGSGRRRYGGGARRCAVNAASGREREFSEILPAPKPRRVVVVGGGPAGMEAARIASLRGHSVTLYEKSGTLGGQMLVSGIHPTKRKILWLRDYLVTQLQKQKVKVELGVVVTPEMIKGAQPDAVVVATGAEPLLPEIPGIKNKNVVGAWDVLSRKVKVDRKKVVVVGGGMVGCEAAECLLDSENQVSIIEQLPSIASDMEGQHRMVILGIFKERNVNLCTNRKVTEINSKGVRVINLESGEEEAVEADQVVIAVGTRRVEELLKTLEGEVPELLSAGDCNQPRVIMEAIYEGSLAGRQV